MTALTTRLHKYFEAYLNAVPDVAQWPGDEITTSKSK